MKVTFECATCGGPVGYDLAAVETHQLRQCVVAHYVRERPCPTCSSPESSADSFSVEAAGVG